VAPLGNGSQGGDHDNSDRAFNRLGPTWTPFVLPIHLEAKSSAGLRCVTGSGTDPSGVGGIVRLGLWYKSERARGGTVDR
jgi:hypothetical protein